MNFTKKTVDMYMWDGVQGGVDPRDLDYQTSEKYHFLKGQCVVGECAIEVQSHIKSHRGEHQFYPDSWFIGEGEYLKPVLCVFKYSFKNFKSQGYGRSGLQKLFELSKQKGCEGRIHLPADEEGPAFYEHCGFVGLVAKEDGIKYFDPTPENIDKLFSKKNVSLDFVRTFKAQKGASLDRGCISKLYHQFHQCTRK